MLLNQSDNVKLYLANFERIARELSQPAQFLRFPDENQVNQEISNIFSQASTILRASVTDPSVCPDETSSFRLEIDKMKNDIHDLSKKLDERETEFAKSLSTARQMMSDRLSDLHKQFQEKLGQLTTEHANEKIIVEKDLMELQDLFDSRLNDEVKPISKEHEDLLIKIVILKDEYEMTNINLKESVSDAKNRMSSLEKQRDKYQNSTIIEDMSNELVQVKEDNSAKIQEKLNHQQQLKNELKKIKTAYKNKIDELNKDIQQFEISSQTKLKKALETQAATYNQKKLKIENEYKKKELDLRRQIEKEEQFNSTSAHKLKADIEEQKRLINDAEDRYKNALHELEIKANKHLSQRENERQNLEKAQAKTLKQLATRHQEALYAVKKDGEMTISSLEQKLHQVNSNSPDFTDALSIASSKKMANMPVSIVPPPKLPGASNKTAPRRITAKLTQPNLPTSSNLSSSSSLLSHQGNSYGEYNSEIIERLKKLDHATKMESYAISKAIDALQLQSTLNQEIIQIEIEKANRQLSYALKEKEITNERIKERDIRRTSLNRNEPESRMNARISAQYTIIAELKNEIQNIKTNNKKVDISEIQKEHKDYLKEMKQRLSSIENANAKKSNQIKEKYSKIINEEIENRQTIVHNLQQRTEEILDELNRTKEMISKEHIQEHQEWMRIRKEMADSTNKILERIQESSSPKSVKQIHVEAKSSLPLLKH